MEVEFLQSSSPYSSHLFQMGSLLHIAGQYEACHSTSNHRGESGYGGGGGYFKQLLEGEQESNSITSSRFVCMAEEDLTPLIVRSREINGKLGTPINLLMDTVDTSPPFRVVRPLASPPEDSRQTSAGDCLDFKPANTTKSPSCIPPNSKRARESSHSEGMDGACKRGKKASEDQEIKGKKRWQQGAAAAGRKVSSTKEKAPKPVLDAEASKLDYVHVRARRGEATDSHSLAERVRREKISERMRFLQNLVPGCSKISGKAMVLDEIINYVQSLQNQVEFLAMRLAAIHPEVDQSSFYSLADEEVYEVGTTSVCCRRCHIFKLDDIASPFIEEAKDHVDMLSRTLPIRTPSCDLHFENLPSLYWSFSNEANFNVAMVSDLSTSACNDSNTTNTMDFSHLS